MCGIAGVIARDQNLVVGALPDMNDFMARRGPDDSGQFIESRGDTTIGLAQRRLSILDLSPEGHQPMVHPDSDDVLVYNGEIYNFQRLRDDLEKYGESFRGRSDTEVLLKGLVRFGTDFIDRLQGMYAFAYYQRQTGRVLLCRDPLGIKPLYVARLDHGMAFASEIQAILAGRLICRERDERAVAGYLAYGSVQDPLTFYRQIRAFPVGAWQWFDVNHAVDAFAPGATRYWTFSPARACEPTVALDQVRQTVEQSVRDHLVSDVPIGVFLSSGLDSTIVASLAHWYQPDIRTFTVGFADQADMSEADLAAGTASLLGTCHEPLQITDAEALDLVERWLTSLDQPSIDGLNVYVISKLVREAGITVALSGQGGDEMFGGYPSFGEVPKLMRLMARLRWLGPAARGQLVGLLGYGRGEAFRQKLMDMARSDGGIRSLYLHRRRTMSDGQLARLGLRADELGLDPLFMPTEGGEYDLPCDEADPVWSLCQLESRCYLRNMLLRDGDVNGMCHSLEIRVPFLDRRVIDLASSIPGSVRLPDGVSNKHMLRVGFAEFFRPALTDKAKDGFTLPIKRWMLGPLRDRCEDALTVLKDSHLVCPEGVDRVWQAYQSSSESQLWSRAWQLCVLGAYLQRDSGRN